MNGATRLITGNVVHSLPEGDEFGLPVSDVVVGGMPRERGGDE
jgi:hypothetical protein